MERKRANWFRRVCLKKSHTPAKKILNKRLEKKAGIANAKLGPTLSFISLEIDLPASE